MKIGLLGYGTVGQGVDLILDKEKKRIEKCLGQEVNISRILVRDKDKYKGFASHQVMTTNINDILGDDQIDVVIEVMGGIEPANTYIQGALARKKHVITANKAVVVAHFKTLFDLAKAQGVSLSIEACVGGGIPLVSTFTDHLLHGQVAEIHGVLNGTSNYILTKMAQEAWSYAQALSSAQSLGYAEAIPHDDVRGYDAARKVMILTSLVTGHYYQVEDVWVSSIEHVTPLDFEMAQHFGGTIKQVASSVVTDHGVSLIVRPVFVKVSSEVGQTHGVDNLVQVKHHHLDTLSLKGPGAGQLATANAVLADLVRLVNQQKTTLDLSSDQLMHWDKPATYYVRTNHAGVQAMKDLGLKYQDKGAYCLVTCQSVKDLVASMLPLDAKHFIAEWWLS